MLKSVFAFVLNNFLIPKYMSSSSIWPLVLPSYNWDWHIFSWTHTPKPSSQADTCVASYIDHRRVLECWTIKRNIRVQILTGSEMCLDIFSIFTEFPNFWTKSHQYFQHSHANIRSFKMRPFLCDGSALYEGFYRTWNSQLLRSFYTSVLINCYSQHFKETIDWYLFIDIDAMQILSGI